MTFKANAGDPNNYRKQRFYNLLAASDPNRATDPTAQDLGDPEKVYNDSIGLSLLPEPLLASRPIKGTKVSVIGDSISASDTIEPGIGSNSTSVSPLYQNSWFEYMCLLGGGVIRRGRNAGIAGQTSSQMIPRMYADVLSGAPSIVVILCGTNDIGQSVDAGGSISNASTISTFQANIQQMVNQCRLYSAEPVLCTIPPNNASNRHSLTTQLNLWLKLYASLSGITLLDFYGQAVDWTTGNYSTAMATGDGTHPGQAGMLLLGQYAANQIKAFIGVNSPLVAQADDDPINLINHPLFGGGAIASNLPPGWQLASGTPTGLTTSYVTDSQVLGNMYQLAVSSSSGPFYVQFPISGSKWSVGDRLAISGILTSNAGIIPNIALADQQGALGKIAPAQAVTRSYFYLEQNVPSRSTSLYLDLNTAQGTGTWSVGQLAVYNLTKLGLTS